MSRIGKLPIKIPENIRVSLDNNKIIFDAGKNKIEYNVSNGINISFENLEIKLTVSQKNKELSTKIGMDRSNIKNIVEGLNSPYKTILEINGVGYKASVEKNILNLTLGYSHEISYALPEGINAVFEKPNLIVLTGSDKILLGQISSEIIGFRPPEPYKGKGVKKAGAKILRKEGKKK
jgi:large subunit ribosomal protein L6